MTGPLMLLAAAAGCGTRAREGDGIGIGVALNPQRPGMQSIYNGVELAVQQINVQYGKKLSGAKVRMVRGLPDVSDPVKIADRLVADASVVGVVGHPESGATLGTIDEYADTKNDGRNAVVAITPTGTSPGLSGVSRWLFRLCPSDARSARVLARFLVDSLHAKRAAVIYRNDSYGKDFAKAFADSYREVEGVIVQRDPYLTGVTAWDAYAGYIKSLKPDVLVFPGSHEDALLALRALRKVGVSIPLIGGDATSGLEASAAEFPDVRYIAFFVPRLATSPTTKAFVEQYTAAYRTAPDQRAALAYDAAMLIGRAVSEVGPDRAKIREYIESVGRTTPEMDGAAGKISFDEKHDAVSKPVVISRVGQ